MVRSTIASMVRRTIANAVNQKQEARNNRLGKLKMEQFRKLEKRQFGKSYNRNNRESVALGSGFETRTIVLEMAVGRLTCIVEHKFKRQGTVLKTEDGKYCTSGGAQPLEVQCYYT